MSGESFQQQLEWAGFKPRASTTEVYFKDTADTAPYLEVELDDFRTVGELFAEWFSNLLYTYQFDNHYEDVTLSSDAGEPWRGALIELANNEHGTIVSFPKIRFIQSEHKVCDERI